MPSALDRAIRAIKPSLGPWYFEAALAGGIEYRADMAGKRFTTFAPGAFSVSTGNEIVRHPSRVLKK